MEWGKILGSMSEEARTYWSAREVIEIAIAEGIDLCRCGASMAFTSKPDGMTRAQLVQALRTLSAIPEDNGDA